MKSYIKDYPRPQMVRKDWTNLNGKWKFAFDDENKGEQECWNEGFASNQEILVPFTYETKMSGVGEEAQHRHVWYETTIIGNKEAEKRYLLHFEGSDYHTKVWINGIYVGDHKGGYERFSFDITNALGNGDNTIVVAVHDTESIRQPRGKQRWMKDNFGCWYVQTTGIWKTVWMESVETCHFHRIKLTPDMEKGILNLEAELAGVYDEASVHEVKGIVSYQKREIRAFSVQGKGSHIRAVVDMKDYSETEWGIHAWTPQNPELYDLQLSLYSGDTLVDTVASYFGMRDIRIEGGNVLLNGHPLYQKLILDQGYWEDSHLTPPSEEALIEDIDKIKALGFNGLRKHMKTEDERFLYWCDVKGMLVWSEMAAAYEFDDEAVENFTAEWMDIVKQNYNHPCIITWTPFNESWGIREVENARAQQHFTEAIYHLTKSFDAMRPVIVNDGWEHTVSDILTLHDYEEKGELFKERYLEKKEEILAGKCYHNREKSALAKGYHYKGQPIIISEYGGIAFTTKEGEWGYGNTVADEEAFLKRYQCITDAIMDVPYISGFCYTQVSDVQQEVNGLMTIDRKFKVNPDKIKAINERKTALHE